MLSVGRSRAGPERELVERYIGRAAAAGRGIGFSPIELREIDESRAQRPQDRKLEEAKTIRAALGARRASSPATRPAKSCRAPISPRNSAMCATLASQRSASSSAARTGSIRPFRAEARLAIAFGAMTWPHQLARVLAAEQIYRAMTILTGHPYHRI